MTDPNKDQNRKGNLGGNYEMVNSDGSRTKSEAGDVGSKEQDPDFPGDNLNERPYKFANTNTNAKINK
jgi:hypothetical protein